LEQLSNQSMASRNLVGISVFNTPCQFHHFTLFLNPAISYPVAGLILGAAELTFFHLMFDFPSFGVILIRQCWRSPRQVSLSFLASHKS